MFRPYATVLLLSAFFTLSACSDGDDVTPQEPVAPETDTTAYPEDPDMQAKDDAGDKPAGDAANGAQGQGEDLPGALTDDPFGAPQGASKDAPVDDTIADSTPNEDVTMPPADSSGVQDAFDDNQAQYQPAPSLEPNVKDQRTKPGKGKTKGKARGKAAKAAPKGKGKVAGKGKAKPAAANAAVVADTAGGGDGKQSMYVNALLLNVRSAPNLKAPIVRRVLGGAMIKVDVEGEYAKIREGEYVKVKYLSDKPTKKTTRGDVQKAWRRSKYKDKWKPQQ